MFPGVAVVTGAAGTGWEMPSANHSRMKATTRKTLVESYHDVRVLAVAGDIADKSFVDSFFEHVFQKFRGVDYAVNCASVTAYCSSKSAVIGVSRCDAIDYAQHGIRVNAVCPGIIATPMTTGSEERIAFLKPAIDIAPTKRMGTAQEVADCVLVFVLNKGYFGRWPRHGL